MTRSQFSYDSVPYPSYTFPQTHPDRLSTIGSLYGIESADPEKCRVLELGCGDGTNLLSFAFALPNSSFIGVDLSSTHVDRAKKAADELMLQNASFQQADITDLRVSDLGQFDFIIAHGLLSWVPVSVRTHVLRIFRDCLSPNGIGYISYNAYPGCHIREISSEIMKLEAALHSDPGEQVKRSMTFLEEIANSAEADSLYQAMLKIELSHIVDRSEQNVYHDDLSAINQPFYFRDFTELLDRSGLRFISEADPSSSPAGKLTLNGQKLLASAGDDVLRREQLIDLIICRRFRCSLVCKAETQIAAVPMGDISGYYVSAKIDNEATSEQLRSNTPVVFRGPDGTTVAIDHPLTKAALARLRELYAHRVPFHELVRDAANDLGLAEATNSDITRTTNILRQFHDAGLVNLHRYQPKFAREIGERPQASRFARWQLRNGSESVTSLAGPNLVPGNTLTKMFLSMLDGHHTVPELISQLELVADVRPDELEDLRRSLPGMIDQELTKFASAGLLTA